MVTRRELLTSALCAGAAGLMNTPFARAAGQPMTLQLSWLFNTASAGELVALEKGFFAEKGLTVTVNPGGPSANVIQELVGGQSDVAIAYAPQIMYARGNGLPLKCFAAAFQKAPLAYYSLAESNIKSMGDWKGKRIGAAQSGLPQIQALLSLNGMTMDDIEFVQTGDTPALLQGQVDVLGTWTTNIGQNQPIFDHAGGYNVQTLWDNGVQFQSNYYIAREETISSDPQMLTAFLEGCDLGWAYTADHREEAVEIVRAKAPALDSALEAASLKITLDEYIYNDVTRENGFGYVSKELWSDTLKTYAALGFIDGELTADDVFDGSILASAKRTKR